MWHWIQRRHIRKEECLRIEDLLSPYLDQTLNSVEQRKVEQHLASCQRCQEELASLRATVAWLHQAPAIMPRRSFTLAKQVGPASRRLTPVALRLATAMVSVALVLLFTGDFLHRFEVNPAPLPGAGTSSQQEKGLSSSDEFTASLTNPQAIKETAGSDTSTQEPAEQSLPGEEETPAQANIRATWVRPVEFSMLGTVVILGGLILAEWRRKESQRRQVR